MHRQVFRQLERKTLCVRCNKKAPFFLCECQLVMGGGEFLYPEMSLCLPSPMWTRKDSDI